MAISDDTNPIEAIDPANSVGEASQEMSLATDERHDPEHNLDDLIKESGEVFQALQQEGNLLQIALFMKLRYSRDVGLLLDEHRLMKRVFLLVAQALEVNLPVNKINTGTGEILNYSIKITEESVLTNSEITLLAVLIRRQLEAHRKSISMVNQTVNNLTNSIENKDLLLRQKDQQILALSQKIKYHTIEKAPYVLAYLSNKGNYFYLANKPKGNKSLRLGKSLNFATALKFNTPQEALTKLIAILKDNNNTVPAAHRMQVFSANLIPADYTVVPNNENLDELRKRAERYEELMKVPAHEKAKVKKFGKTRIVKPSKNKTK